MQPSTSVHLQGNPWNKFDRVYVLMDQLTNDSYILESKMSKIMTFVLSQPCLIKTWLFFIWSSFMLVKVCFPGCQALEKIICTSHMKFWVKTSNTHLGNAITYNSKYWKKKKQQLILGARKSYRKQMSNSGNSDHRIKTWRSTGV